jgi:NAD(P)-dependent dehydrogenase (short-subunit alcohol dehydrogenase family)
MSANSETLIVTGGSRGIGAAIAKLAAQHGYAIAVNYVSDARAASSVVAEIEKNNGRAIAIQADVSSEPDVLRMFETAERKLGRVAALVNNAGITGGFSRLQDVQAKTFERVLSVNVTGAFLCTREAVRRMSHRNGGAGEWVHYAMTKGALDTLTIGLAREVAQEGIRVNAVAPGLVETDIHSAAGDPGRPERMAPGIPLGRAGTPEEIAEAVYWLLSPAAAYVTGTILSVSGGR